MGRDVPTYGLCLLCGALLAGLIALARGRRCRVKGEDVIFCGMYGAIGALIGAKLGFILVHAGEVRDMLSAGAGLRGLLQLLTGSGFLSFGAMAGGFIGFLLYCREFKCDRDALACCLLPAAPLMLAWCRLGCFCAGCCYGKAWDGPLAVVNTCSPVGINNVPLFPVQLLAAALALLLCIVMLALPKLRRPVPASRPAGFFMAAFAAGRFCLEFLRGDHADKMWQGLTWAQWVCLALLIVGLLLYRRGNKQASA